MKRLIILFLLTAFSILSTAQSLYTIKVHGDSIIAPVNPIWKDYYEMHLMFGYGDNPFFSGPHSTYINSNSLLALNEMKIRSLRLSIGRADSPPDTNYYSTNTNILKNLACEFYRGGNNLADATDTTKYNFTYIDSLIDIAASISEEIVLGLDYMPFTLSSDTIPNYSPLINLVHFLAFDNSIRNSPPANNVIYGEVMYQLMRHCYYNKGVKIFEFWNEPDQTIGNTFFWKGTATQLYDAYESVINHLNQDPTLQQSIKIGGCSFAMNSPLNLFVTSFLNLVQQNNTRLDFLSVHPYTDIGAGYDSNKIILAKTWLNQYVPQAEIWNTEWSRIDMTPPDSMRAKYDYGLLKLQASFDMLNRGVARAHQASLADASVNTSENTGIGSYNQGPFSIKQSAMPNKFMNHFYPFTFNFNNSQRLKVHTQPHLMVEANMSNIFGLGFGVDEIWVALPLDSIYHANDTVIIEIYPDQFGFMQDSYFNRHEYSLVEGLNQSSQNITKSGLIGAMNVFRDTIINTPKMNNGNLFLWKIGLRTVGLNDYKKSKSLSIYPNPNNGSFRIKNIDNKLKGDYTVKVLNTMGQELHSTSYSTIHDNSIELALPQGLYFIELTNTKESIRSSIIIQ